MVAQGTLDEAPGAPSSAEATGKEVIQTKDLSRRFGGLTAVDSVSFSLHEHELVGLIGPNGAGKTVLLNCISGAMSPSSGSIAFFGEDVTGWSPEKACRSGLSRTFQVPHPFPEMTALENVRVSAQFGRSKESLGKKRADTFARETLERVAFEHPVDTPIIGLNTVDLKRVDLARALASEPRVIFLDELAAGLMSGQLADLEELIRQIHASGVTILMVEHILPTILQLCERVIVIQAGRKIADGVTAEVMCDPKVVEAYLGEQEAVPDACST